MFTLALSAFTAHPFLSVSALGFAVLGMSWISSEPIVSLLSNLGLVDGTTGLLTPVRALLVKTADYVLTGAEASGTLFTTTGAAGAVNFTLPAASARLAGKWYGFRNAVNQNMTVTAGAGTVVTFNNAAATSVAASTLNQKIGAHMVAICDGTKWHIEGTTVGVTYTVA